MMARPGRRSRTLATRRVSQVAGLACAIGGNCLLGKNIEFAIACITFDRRIEPLGIERLEPRAKSCQLARRQLLDGFLNVFCGCHPGNIPSEKHREKPRNPRLGLA